MRSIQKFLEEEKALHEESLRKRDQSFKEFADNLENDIKTANTEKFAVSISEFLKAEEEQAERFAAKMASLKIS